MINIRLESYKIIVKVLKNNKFSDKLLHQMSKKIKNLGDNSDLLYALVKGVIKMQQNLEYIISQYTDEKKYKNTVLKIKVILYIAFYQLLYMDKIPDHAAVHEAVELAKSLFDEKISQFVNAVLRGFLRNKEFSYPKDPLLQMAYEYSFPKEIIKKWLYEYGEEETEMLCMYFNDIPQLSIRINSLETNKKKIINYFLKKNVAFSESEASEYILKSKDVKKVLNDVAFSEGYYSVQDSAAALVVELMNPKKHLSILDLFAAPGGKATFISEIMKNTGEVIANDKIPNKTKLLKKANERLKIENMKIISGDAFSYGPIAPSFDHVLLDVPCSGWGVFQKKAELRWQLNQDLPKLIKLQEDALNKGAQFVKLGGYLTYSTCTLNREENEEQIEKFLTKNPSFQLCDAKEHIPSKFVEKGFLKTIPHKHEMDGAFAAKLKKFK